MWSDVVELPVCTSTLNAFSTRHPLSRDVLAALFCTIVLLAKVD